MIERIVRKRTKESAFQKYSPKWSSLRPKSSNLRLFIQPPPNFCEKPWKWQLESIRFVVIRNDWFKCICVSKRIEHSQNNEECMFGEKAQGNKLFEMVEWDQIDEQVKKTVVNEKINYYENKYSQFLRYKQPDIAWLRIHSLTLRQQLKCQVSYHLVNLLLRHIYTRMTDRKERILSAHFGLCLMSNWFIDFWMKSVCSTLWRNQRRKYPLCREWTFLLCGKWLSSDD